MELGIEIHLPETMEAEARDKLLKAFEADLREVDPEASVSALRPYTLLDPNLLHIIVQTLGSLDPATAFAGAAGVGIAPRVLRRAITRLVAFAKQFARPITVKVDGISFQLPPDTPAAEVGKIVTQVSAKLRQQQPASPKPQSRNGGGGRKPNRPTGPA